MPDKRATQSALNGANSIGPKTPEGLAKCREAAQRLRKQRLTTLLLGESPDAFEAFRAKLHAFWQPENQAEIQMVDDLASSIWILNREIFSKVEPHFDCASRSVYNRSLRACLRKRDRIAIALCERKNARKVLLSQKTNHLTQSKGPTSGS